MAVKSLLNKLMNKKNPENAYTTNINNSGYASAIFKQCSYSSKTI